MRVNLLPVLLLLAAAHGWCQDDGQPAADNASAPQPTTGRTWSIHFQATSIGQEHGWFPSLYEGLNSLPSHPEHRASLTATVFLSLRLNSHWELVADPELAGGRGFGNVTGIAGFTNGEIPRVASATPTLYPARAYVRYIVALGAKVERVADSANQAAGTEPVSRLSLTTGKFAITDYFDNNTYSHDPRSQFMNWAMMYNGAWDYPADTRGYTIGTVEELKTPTWALRAASVMEPTTANGPTLDTRIGRNRGLAIEYEHDHFLARQNGAFRVLIFDNLEDAGTYREAMRGAGEAPDLAATRRNGTKKYGFGFNAEQQLSSTFGVFGRYGWNDGKTETWAFTEIDRSLSGGVSIKGKLWRRRADNAGVGAVRNYISGDHRAFLAAGGYGFIIGDGRLNYGPEQIVEAYYSIHVPAGWTVSPDVQWIANPAYNQDRGPVLVGSIRLHWEH
jgi:high affinity Mn2+ porin